MAHHLVTLSNNALDLKALIEAQDSEEAMTIAEELLEQRRYNELNIVGFTPGLGIFDDMEIAGTAPYTGPEIKETQPGATGRPHKGDGKRQSRKAKIDAFFAKAGGAIRVVSAGIVTTAAAITAATAAYGAFHESRHQMARVAARKPASRGLYE